MELIPLGTEATEATGGRGFPESVGRLGVLVSWALFCVSDIGQASCSDVSGRRRITGSLFYLLCCSGRGSGLWDAVRISWQAGRVFLHPHTVDHPAWTPGVPVSGWLRRAHPAPGYPIWEALPLSAIPCPGTVSPSFKENGGRPGTVGPGARRDPCCSVTWFPHLFCEEGAGGHAQLAFRSDHLHREIPGIGSGLADARKEHLSSCLVGLLEAISLISQRSRGPSSAGPGRAGAARRSGCLPVGGRGRCTRDGRLRPPRPDTLFPPLIWMN